MSKSGKNINFEKSLTELDTLVAQMESGELSLEQSLQSYEKGVKLVQLCQTALAQAEQKVKILTEKAGLEEMADFDHEDEDAEEFEDDD